MTENRIYETPSRVGRRKEFDIRITLPLSEEMLRRIDAVLAGDEPRLDLIREAIDRELKRRERAKKPSDPSNE